MKFGADVQRGEHGDVFVLRHIVHTCKTTTDACQSTMYSTHLRTVIALQLKACGFRIMRVMYVPLLTYVCNAAKNERDVDQKAGRIRTSFAKSCSEPKLLLTFLLSFNNKGGDLLTLLIIMI